MNKQTQPAVECRLNGMVGPQAAESAMRRFEYCDGREEPDPLERLRFFCSLAMCGQDWLDVEQFFDDVHHGRE